MMIYDPNRGKREVNINWKDRIKYFFIIIIIILIAIISVSAISTLIYNIRVPEEARDEIKGLDKEIIYYGIKLYENGYMSSDYSEWFFSKDQRDEIYKILEIDKEDENSNYEYYKNLEWIGFPEPETKREEVFYYDYVKYDSSSASFWLDEKKRIENGNY